jgi:tRNA threonylcarbamoyladenosine biosynthesis protein TsaB
MIESALNTLKLTVPDIDLFACSAGPGSFTGVRIGAAVIKGLAFGRGENSCVGVSTLEALAYNLVGHAGLICPVMNARRSQVYTALFESDGVKLTRLTEDAPMMISELDAMLSGYGRPVRFCGDGYSITLAELKNCEYIDTPDRSVCQSAYSVGRVALDKYRQGGAVSDTELVATYLRPCQAERELAEKMKKAD